MHGGGIRRANQFQTLKLFLLIYPLRAFRLAESIRRSEVHACMYVRMPCDVMLFFVGFCVKSYLKSVPNLINIGPNSSPIRYKSVPEALRSDKLRPEALPRGHNAFHRRVKLLNSPLD